MTAPRLLIAAEWTAATTLAVLGAQLAAEIAGLFGGYLILVLVPVLPIAAGGLAGIAIGGLQWFVLRRTANRGLSSRSSAASVWRA